MPGSVFKFKYSNLNYSALASIKGHSGSQEDAVTDMQVEPPSTQEPVVEEQVEEVEEDVVEKVAPKTKYVSVYVSNANNYKGHSIAQR